MRKISVEFGNRVQNAIDLGFAGEHVATQIALDCNSIIQDWADATVSMVVWRPDDQAYVANPPKAIGVDGYVLFDVTNLETAVAGNGKIEFRAVRKGGADEGVIKTYAIRYLVRESIFPMEEEPIAPRPTWVDELIDSAQGLREATQEAMDTALLALETAQNHSHVDYEERLDLIEQKMDQITSKPKAYGVYFDGIHSKGTRLGDAVQMRFTPSVGNRSGIDDWAKVKPFAVREVNIDTEKDEIVAIRGIDEEFTRDGSNGDVFVEFPIGYFKRTQNEDGSYEIWISESPLEGYSPSPAHMRGGNMTEHTYAAKYKAYWDGERMRSISGVYPTGFMTRAIARQRCSSLGNGNKNYLQYDAAFHSWLQMLMAVKYGDMNVQNVIGHGLYGLIYDDSIKTTMETVSGNRFVIAKTHASRFAVGLMVQAGTKRGDHTYTQTPRCIMAINPIGEGNKSEILVDGNPFSADIGAVLWCCGQLTGETDNIEGTCGRADYLLGLNSQISTFGLESTYAERHTWEDGHNVHNNQTFVSTNPEEYADNIFAGSYVKLSYVNASTIGYIKSFGFDIQCPWMCVCTEVGGEAENPVGDYYVPYTGMRVARVGGYLNGALASGSHNRMLDASIATAQWDTVARVMKIGNNINPTIESEEQR